MTWAGGARCPMLDGNGDGDGDGSVQSKTNPNKAGKRGNCVSALDIPSLSRSPLVHLGKHIIFKHFEVGFSTFDIKSRIFSELPLKLYYLQSKFFILFFYHKIVRN